MEADKTEGVAGKTEEEVESMKRKMMEKWEHIVELIQQKIFLLISKS